LKIEGMSMSPLLRNGDFILMKKINSNDKFYLGQIVELNHPNLGKIVKEIIKIKKNKVLVSGRSKLSIEPFSTGWLDKSCILSKLFFGITSKEGLLNKK
jgi:signal peptidase I